MGRLLLKPSVLVVSASAVCLCLLREEYLDFIPTNGRNLLLPKMRKDMRSN